MYYIINYMDRTTSMQIHLGSISRLMPTVVKVQTLGYLADKNFWMKGLSHSLVFSYILKGEGLLHFNSRTFPIKAPCAMVQFPGMHLSYGPTPEGSSWSELYVLPSSELFEKLPECGIDVYENPIWSIKNIAKVNQCVSELFEYSTRVGNEGVADRIDRIAERLLLESRLETIAKAKGPYFEKLNELRNYFLQHPKERPDFSSLSQQCGMSNMTLRRHWVRYFGTTPCEDLMNLRMQEACKMLAETDEQIQVIAYHLGFKDALYFSRCFSKTLGTSPSEYRKKYSIQHIN